MQATQAAVESPSLVLDVCRPFVLQVRLPKIGLDAPCKERPLVLFSSLFLYINIIIANFISSFTFSEHSYVNVSIISPKTSRSFVLRDAYQQSVRYTLLTALFLLDYPRKSKNGQLGPAFVDDRPDLSVLNSDDLHIIDSKSITFTFVQREP